MRKFLLQILGINSVYVLVAHENESEKVKEVDVYLSSAKAFNRRDALIKIYGSRNVCMACREVDEIDD